MVNDRDGSYMNGARMNIDRISGKAAAIVDSAARFVVIYRAGRTGAPAAAETYKKVGTLVEDDCFARDIAAYC